MKDNTSTSKKKVTSKKKTIQPTNWGNSSSGSSVRQSHPDAPTYHDYSFLSTAAGD